MAYLPNSSFSLSQNQVSIDPSGRLRVSEVLSVGDYRFQGTKDPDNWDEKIIGAATSSFVSAAQPYIKMDVTTTNDAIIRQTRQWHPYFAGKPNIQVHTMLDFDLETDIIKRFGYFSSNTTTPWNSTLDGFFVEADGTTGTNTYNIELWRSGTNTATIPRSSWDDKLDGTGASGINLDATGAGGTTGWEGFTVWGFDFLWLGGTALRVLIKSGGIWHVVHTFNHAGLGYPNVIIASPSQPVRVEIRSVAASATGTYQPICHSVAVEGVDQPTGMPYQVNTDGNTLNCNTVGTKYAIAGIRLDSSFSRGISAFLHTVNILATSNSNFAWELQISPTLANDLTWSNIGNALVETGIGDTVNNPSNTTVSADGIILNSGLVAQREASSINFNDERRVGSLIDGTRETLVLIAIPITGNQNIGGSIHYVQK